MRMRGRAAGEAPELGAGTGGVVGEWNNCYLVGRVPVTGA